MSYTFTLSGNSSTLSADYFPPIILNPGKIYVLGLVTFQSYNSIPNIDDTCNIFSYDNGTEKIKIPTGSYTIEDINKYLQDHIRDHDQPKNTNSNTIHKAIKGPHVTIRANNNTLKSEIFCRWDIDFDDEQSLYQLLGYERGDALHRNQWNESPYPIKISKVNTIKVECNITVGAFSNHLSVHTIHEFSPDVPPGFKISESPQTIIYMPVGVRMIDNITLTIVDQNGCLINFRGEEITIRLHLKEL